jgi:16S rRNA processing protein RimM
MKKEDLVLIASASHPHGLKGEVELRLLNDNPEESILDDGMKVYLYPFNEKSKLSAVGEEWKITKIRFGNKAICHFDGVKDRTQLETMLPFEIYVHREDFPEPDADEFYLVDLIDMMVVSPEGEELGKIESFSDNGMQYLFEVRLVNGERITLPYVDAFFPEVDMEAKKVVMIMPDYTE